MGDYYRVEQVANKLGLTVQELKEAEAHGLIRPIPKDGVVYYNSHQVYRLKAACRLRQKKGWSWGEVADEFRKRPLYQVATV